MTVDLTLRFEIEDIYADYADALDTLEIERWPDFFVEDCFYEVIPRENYDRHLPLAILRCDSRGMLQDRVTAIQETMMFEPRYMRHLVSGFRVRPETDGSIGVTANYAVLETLPDELTRIFSAGRYVDILVRDNGVLRFREKHCVFDSSLVPNSLIYPI